MKVMARILISGGIFLIFTGCVLFQSGDSGRTLTGAFTHIDWAIAGCGVAAEMIGITILRKEKK
jgi:hypothetical protein